MDELTLGDSHAGTVLEAESNMGVLLALFIAGREDADGGVLVVAGPQTLGDHLDGISELRVDVGMTQGDFDVEFLLTWNEVNTNPAHYADESQPTGLSHTYRLALVVIAMDRMLNNKTEDKLEIFNLGTGRGVTVLELINAFEKGTGVKVPHKIVGRREGDIEKVWANPEHANNVLGWTAKESVEDTLITAWNWQKRLREKGIQ